MASAGMAFAGVGLPVFWCHFARVCLPGEKQGAPSVTVFEDLQHVVALLVGQGRDAPGRP